MIPMRAALTKSPPKSSYPLEKIRQDFPILKVKVRDKLLVYLDNAATTQKPRSVIETLERYYAWENSNIHRGIHYLSERATASFEGAREKVRKFLNAADSKEIVFTKGATEAVNLVAHSFGGKFVGAGDEILISTLEPHSNIVPWQILCESSGAILKVIPINDQGELLLPDYEKLLSVRTKLVAVTHVSNALGTVNPVEEMIRLAHGKNIPVLVDGAQAVPHLKVDVQKLDCDFYLFSGHKVYGPTGIGVLYGKAKWLEEMPPYQGGGDMISSVTFEKTTYNKIPYKFEAGTPHIAGAIGLGAALDYIQETGIERIAGHEQELLTYGTELLSKMAEVKIVGEASHKAAVISFTVKDVHPHDIGTLLDGEGVAIRAGHHCAMPLMQRLKLPATCRASFGLYNPREEVDRLAKALRKAIEVFD